MITPKWLLKQMDDRDERRSAWTGLTVPDLVPQHRQGGSGGRRDKHRLSNVVWLESLYNGLIESDSKWQLEAKRRGIKISGFAKPEDTPILHAIHGWCLLGDDGSHEAMNDAEIAEWLALQGGGMGAER